MSLFSPCSLRLAAYTAALALDTLSSVATNSDTATATVDPGQDSPSSETTTLTCSLSTPANDPSDPSDPLPNPVPAPAPTPESNTAPPTPLITTSAVEAKMAPLVEKRGSITAEEQEKMNTPPRTPEWTRSQKSGAPIPPKRRHSPKLAALNAKGSPPVSPLAATSSSSPTFDTKKPAPSPPVTQVPIQPHSVALDTETPAQTASTRAPNASQKADSDLKQTAADPSGYSLTASETNNNRANQTLDNTPTAKDAATSSPSVIHGALKDLDAEESTPLVADVPTPLPVIPISSIPAPTNLEAPIINDFLTSLSDTYDFLTPEGPKNADLELELTNGTERPSLPSADLISLESPPSVPSMPNGDGADLPLSGPVLEASETLAKTAPPVNDEYGSL